MVCGGGGKSRNEPAPVGGAIAMEPLKRGTRVRYHGSMEEYHDEEFVITDRHEPHVSSMAHYPDGVAYVLAASETTWERPAQLHNVRRGSFTVVDEVKGE